MISDFTPDLYRSWKRLARAIFGSIWASGLALALASPVSAQGFDLVGTRARGMGGAFVAVADDASATWWNAAGIPNSFIFDGVIDFQSSQLINGQPTPAAAQTPGFRTGATGVAASVPSLGFSYYRVRQSGIEPATAGEFRSRQDPGIAPLARSLLTQQFGVTFAQSLGDRVVVGATARLLRGSVGTAPASFSDPEPGLDAAGKADGPAVTRGDLDIGVLARVSRLRLGFSARNLTAPSFHAADGTPWRLDRLARVGVALVADPDRPGRQAWTVAFDADLRREWTPFGDRRDVAAGAERWFRGRRVAIRGGFRASTVDQARPAASAGGSLAVRRGIWLEGQATGGGDGAPKGWGLSAHLMF
jgi:hypothetical protein